jgi:hypothetical protein
MKYPALPQARKPPRNGLTLRVKNANRRKFNHT